VAEAALVEVEVEERRVLRARWLRAWILRLRVVELVPLVVQLLAAEDEEADAAAVGEQAERHQRTRRQRRLHRASDAEFHPRPRA